MKRTPATRAILATLLVASLLIVPGAQASEEEDSDWREEPRDLALERTPDELRFTSVRDSELGEDTLQVRYDHDAGRLEHRFTTFDTKGQGLQFVYQTTILSVIEFRDGRESGPWGPEAETVETYRFDELERRPLERQEILQGQGYHAIAEYVIPDRREDDEGPLEEPSPLSDGLLRIGFTMVERPERVDGVPLSPTGLLVDLEIVDPPYRQDDTRLALEMSLTGTRMDNLSTLDTVITQQAGLYESAFSWSPTARTDQSPSEAAVTLLSSPEGGSDPDQEVLLIAAYPRGDETSHSWKLQTNRYTEPVEEVVQLFTRGQGLIFSGALIATLAIAGPPVVKRLRGK